MENTTMTNETRKGSTMQKLLDAIEMVKNTPSCKLLENADLLLEAIGNLKIRVGEVAVDEYIRFSAVR
jgi:hypothetical protein